MSENSIFKYLNKLWENKYTGLNGIPARFVRDCATSITFPLTHIVNLTRIQGTVPDDLKAARVVPLYKKDDTTEIGNYQPVVIKVLFQKFSSCIRPNLYLS